MASMDAIQELSVALADALNLSKLPAHFSDIISSFFFFTAVQVLISPLLSAALFPHSFGTAGQKTKNNWNVHVVSLVHSLIIIPLAARCLNFPALDEDRAFGWDGRVGRVSAISSGYFIWDTIESCVHFSDIGFVVHGLSCLFIYMLGFRPFLAYYAVRFLLWEISTPFLNIHWFLDKTGHTGSVLQLLNGLFLLGTFFGARLIFGGIMSYRFFHTLYTVRYEIPLAFVLLYGVGNVVLQALNWIWFIKMIRMLRKRMGAPPSSKNHLHVNGSGNGIVPHANGKTD